MAKHAFYDSKAWRDTRSRILKRDKYTCQECSHHCLGKKYGKSRPYVDHIKPRPHVDYATRFDVDSNLQVLCHTCHQQKTSFEQSERVEIGADGFPVGGEWS